MLNTGSVKSAKLVVVGRISLFAGGPSPGDQAAARMPADVFRLFAQVGYAFQGTHRHWLASSWDIVMKKCPAKVNNEEKASQNYMP
jgi:hypothetical protein